MRQNLQTFAVFSLLTLSLAASFCTKDDKCEEPISDAARYDNYRMFYVNIDTLKQVEILQNFEDVTDSCIFMGHAINPGQKLSILVAAHKVADFVDLLKTYEMTYKILVSIYSAWCSLNLRKSVNTVLLEKIREC